MPPQAPPRRQVEDLDRTSVKQHQRIRAAEVVPNLDSVTEKPAVHVKYVRAGAAG